MSIHLRARGQDRFGGEFVFLGRPPRQQWWRAYRQHFEAESPTVLVVSDHSGWRVMLAGVPTALRDVSDRAPTYTIVLEGDHGDPDARLATGLIAAFIDELGGAEPARRAGAAVDEQLTPDTIERLRAWTLRDNRQDEAADAVASAVRAAMASLPLPSPRSAAGEPPSWAAPVTDPAARSAALARIASLLAGTPGVVAYLNLPTRAEVVRPMGAVPGGAAILLRPDAELPAGLTGLGQPDAPLPEGPLPEGPGVTEGPSGPKALAGRAPARRLILLAALPLLALAALLAVILLF